MASTKDPYIQARGLQRLPAALLSHTFSFLPPNERSLTARFICREASAALSDAIAHTASLAQPLPAHAAPWAVEAGQQYVRQLPFEYKLQLLGAATATGSEVNLEVALALLQPSIFPEMLVTGNRVWFTSEVLPDPGPGEAAVAAGHPQLLRWLVHHCPALMDPERVLEAAAEHCDLAGLQDVWRVLNGEEQPVDWVGQPRPAVDQCTLLAAARSLTPDAVAKMEWVLGAARENSCSLDIGTVQNAVHTGDLGRLRWLQGRGCQLNDPRGYVLPIALEYADMSMVQWLVNEAGCDLLGPRATHREYWDWLVAGAARGPDGLARVLWLQERGVVLKDGLTELLDDEWMCKGEFAVGQPQALQYIMQRHSDDLSAQQLAELGRQLQCAAVVSGSVALVEELRQSGVMFDHLSYEQAGCTCNVEMIRWLVTGAKVPIQVQELILYWRHGTPARSQGLLEAVQLLVGAGAGADSWDVQQALCYTAWQGNLPAVQFLAEHLEQQLGCQPDWHHVMTDAAVSGCEALLEWLAGKAGCLADAGVSYMPAAKAGDRATLAALRRLGVPWGSGFTVAQAVEECCPAPVLQWLVEQGVPVGSKGDMEQAVAAAAERKRELGAEAAAWLLGLAEAEAEAAAG